MIIVNLLIYYKFADFDKYISTIQQYLQLSAKEKRKGVTTYRIKFQLPQIRRNYSCKLDGEGVNTLGRELF